MTANKKDAWAGTLASSKTASNEHKNSTQDPLRGWFDLAKPSRQRQQKTAWKRGKLRGYSAVYALLIIQAIFWMASVVFMLLTFGGLAHV